MDNNSSEFMTSIEAANYLHCTPQTVIKYIKDGYLQGYKLGKNRSWFLKRTDIEKFMRPMNKPMRRFGNESDDTRIVLYD